MRPRGRIDVKVAILGRDRVECPNCGREHDLGDCSPFFRERAGLTVVECKCKTCEQRWRRLDFKAKEAA